jgi:hypothetical protein
LTRPPLHLFPAQHPSPYYIKSHELAKEIKHEHRVFRNAPSQEIGRLEGAFMDVLVDFRIDFWKPVRRPTDGVTAQIPCCDTRAEAPSRSTKTSNHPIACSLRGLKQPPGPGVILTSSLMSLSDTRSPGQTRGSHPSNRPSSFQT